MDGDEVAARQQFLLGGGEPHAGGLGALGRQVRAPGRHVHAEGLADPRDPAAGLAEAEQAESAPVQVGAEGALPRAPLAQGGVLRDDLPGQAEDQGPGEFDRGFGVAGRPAHGDTVPGGRLKVDGGVSHAGGDEECEARQPREHLLRERRALAHRDDDLAVADRVGQVVGGGEVLRERSDVHRAGEAGPVGGRQRHVLVVVEYRAAQLHRHPSPGVGLP